VVLPSFALCDLLKVFPKFPIVHGCSHFLIRWQENGPLLEAAWCD
jgi:hypothetical protein